MPTQGDVPAHVVPEKVRLDDPMEGMVDTHGPGITVGVTEPVVPMEGLFFSMSDLLGSRLAPPLSGGRDPVGGNYWWIERPPSVIPRCSWEGPCRGG